MSISNEFVGEMPSKGHETSDTFDGDCGFHTGQPPVFNGRAELRFPSCIITIVSTDRNHRTDEEHFSTQYVQVDF